MRLLPCLAAVALAMAACTATPTPSPQASYGPPAVECADVYAATECQDMAAAALDAVRPSGLPPIHVWIRGFTLCGGQYLFDMQALNCPVPADPPGGSWQAGVEIAFDGTDQHAGVNIAEIGRRYAATLIGYRVPDPGWCEWLGDCLPVASPT